MGPRSRRFASGRSPWVGRRRHCLRLELAQPCRLHQRRGISTVPVRNGRGRKLRRRGGRQEPKKRVDGTFGGIKAFCAVFGWPAPTSPIPRAESGERIRLCHERRGRVREVRSFYDASAPNAKARRTMRHAARDLPALAKECGISRRRKLVPIPTRVVADHSTRPPTNQVLARPESHTRRLQRARLEGGCKTFAEVSALPRKRSVRRATCCATRSLRLRRRNDN